MDKKAAKRSLAAQAREKAGLTLEQAARRLGNMKPSTLANYERCGCGEYRARDIATLYQCPMEFFLYGSNSALARSKAHSQHNKEADGGGEGCGTTPATCRCSDRRHDQDKQGEAGCRR